MAETKHNTSESIFFGFEQDFVESGVRCIPMIVRFKLDHAGIKLKLSEWSRMSEAERRQLAEADCESPEEVSRYRTQLSELIFKRTGDIATPIPVPENPAWSRTDEIPYTITEKLREVSSALSIKRWRTLTPLQRFALLKLSYPGHEHKNFSKALMEFGLTED